MGWTDVLTPSCAMMSLRSVVAAACRYTPNFKGKGRMVLLFDRLITTRKRAASYIAVGRINGLAEMVLDLRAWGQKFAYYYGEWEKEYIDHARRLYKGGTIIDVGSSLGLYVICLGDLARAMGSTVVSVEPVPFNLERQKMNVILNRLDDVVEYHRLALGARATTLRISHDPSRVDNNAYISGEGDMEIQVTALDTLVSLSNINNVGFIKMDVEGYEPMVLEGGKDTIIRDHPLILAEFNRERMKINGFEIMPSWYFLKSEGYAAFAVERGTLLRLTEPAEYENIFFVPRHMLPLKT